MKQLLIKLAGLFGLVPARRYKVLATQLDEVRLSAQNWKARAGEASGRVKSLEGEVTEQARHLKDVQKQLERVRGHDGEAARLREQLLKTERALMVAREHLMAVEVKLDILEGAANVLDARTRTIRAGEADRVAR